MRLNLFQKYAVITFIAFIGLILFLAYHYAQKLKQKRNPNKYVFYFVRDLAF